MFRPSRAACGSCHDNVFFAGALQADGGVDPNATAAVFDPPTRYVRTVVVWQLADWALRFTTVWFFLGAFGIPQSVEHAVLVQATMSLATLVPATPGGIGTEQAFIVYVFRGTVSGSKLLAFSVGMKLTLVATNVIVGFAALALTLRTFNVGGWIRRRRDEAPAET